MRRTYALLLFTCASCADETEADPVPEDVRAFCASFVATEFAGDSPECRAVERQACVDCYVACGQICRSNLGLRCDPERFECTP